MSRSAARCSRDTIWSHLGSELRRKGRIAGHESLHLCHLLHLRHGCVRWPDGLLPAWGLHGTVLPKRQLPVEFGAFKRAFRMYRVMYNICLGTLRRDGHHIRGMCPALIISPSLLYQSCIVDV
jgi:hypothetical protein